jgi:hypothetical protein
MSRSLAAAAMVLVVPALTHARLMVSVTTCGQVIERGQVGVLMTDLACGHQWGTCRACASCAEIVPAIPCSGPADCPDPAVNKCDGIEAVPSVGVYVVPGARLELNGHSISGAQAGILGGRPDGTDGNASISVTGPGTVFATREAVRFYHGKLRSIALHDNLYGVAASKARLTDVDASGNTIGVSVFDSVRARGLTCDDNRSIGLLSYARARVSQSHLTGNAEQDITTEDPPRVSRTVCEHSAALEETGQPGIYSPSGPPWGVCSGD